MVFAIFSHAHLPFCTVFATCVPLQAIILYSICCMLIVQTFMWVSLGSLGCQLGSLEGIFSASFGVSLGFHYGFFRVSFRVSRWVSLGCHLGHL